MDKRLVACLLALAAVAAAQEQVKISGRAVDADGKPVGGATVAAFWTEGEPVDGVTTDAEGRFTLTADYYGRGNVAILLLDRERKRGAVSRFSQASFGKERELTLEPVVAVQGKFSCSDLGAPPPWTNVYVFVEPGQTRVAQYSSRDADFRFALPPGDYKFMMYGTDVDGRNEECFIEGTEGTIDFGTLDLPATNLAKLYGKEAPRIQVTEARGVKPDVQLADYKGRYVVIEFWGFW